MRKFIFMLVIAMVLFSINTTGQIPIGITATPQKVVIAGGSTNIHGSFPDHYRIYNKIIVMPVNNCGTKTEVEISGTASQLPGWIKGDFNLNLNLGSCFGADGGTTSSNITNPCIVGGQCTYQNKDLMAYVYACFVNQNKTWICEWYPARLNYSVITPQDNFAPQIKNTEPNAVLYVKKGFDPNDKFASLDLYKLKNVEYLENLTNFEYSATVSDCSNITNSNIFLNSESAGEKLPLIKVLDTGGVPVIQDGECLCGPSDAKTFEVSKTISCSNQQFSAIGYSAAINSLTGAVITGGQNLTGGVCEPGGPIPSQQIYGSFTPEQICSGGTAKLNTGCNTIRTIATDTGGNYQQSSNYFYVVPQGNSILWAKYSASTPLGIPNISICKDSPPLAYVGENSLKASKYLVSEGGFLSGGSSWWVVDISCYHTALWVENPSIASFGITFRGSYNFYVNGNSIKTGSSSLPAVHSVQFELRKGWNYFDVVLNPTSYSYQKYTANVEFNPKISSYGKIMNPGARPDNSLYPRRDYNVQGNMV